MGLTLADIAKIIVLEPCRERDLCAHDVKVHLLDGRKADIATHELISLIRDIGTDKINPGEEWNGEQVKAHFAKYNFELESPSFLLNKIFQQFR